MNWHKILKGWFPCLEWARKEVRSLLFKIFKMKPILIIPYLNDVNFKHLKLTEICNFMHPNTNWIQASSSSFWGKSFWNLYNFFKTFYRFFSLSLKMIGTKEINRFILWGMSRMNAHLSCRIFPKIILDFLSWIVGS